MWESMITNKGERIEWDCSYGWMDGWMDEWMDGWIDGWMDGWMDG